ncbi:MAG: hypothetical protein ACPGXZ_07495, partial [Saprospiraceae bacterium]
LMASSMFCSINSIIYIQNSKNAVYFFKNIILVILFLNKKNITLQAYYNIIIILFWNILK